MIVGNNKRLNNDGPFELLKMGGKRKRKKNQKNQNGQKKVGHGLAC